VSKPFNFEKVRGMPAGLVIANTVERIRSLMPGFVFSLPVGPRPRIARNHNRNHNRKLAEAKRLRMVNARRSKRPAT
jgi:hypothetical protein